MKTIQWCETLLPKKFIDRRGLFRIIQDEYDSVINEEEKKKIIAIYGIGGIGKSRFLKELFNKLTRKMTAHEAIYLVSLALSNQTDLLDVLLRIRRQIPQHCLFFDYTLLLIWDHLRIDTLDNHYLGEIKDGLISIVLRWIDVAATTLLPIPITSENIIEVVTIIIPKLLRLTKSHEERVLFEKIKELSSFSPKELLRLLPMLLGDDINSSTRHKALVLLIDSYNEPDDKCGWLSAFVGALDQGLIVITSREQIQEFECDDYFVYRMDTIPQESAKKMLSHYIESRHQELLIPLIINKSQCIPVYLDLAINLYSNVRSEKLAEIKSAFEFETSNDIVTHFLDHLCNKDQEAIITLSVIRVFDQRIFEHLVKDLNLECSVLEFANIIKNSLVNCLNDCTELFMIHEVIAGNITNLTPNMQRHRILESYIGYISKRAIYQYSIETLKILYQNVLTLVTYDYFELNVHEIESILDIFFYIFEKSPTGLESHASRESTGIVNVMIRFANAVTKRLDDLQACLKSLDAIRGDINQLGKHSKSFHAAYAYALALSGEYANSGAFIFSLYNSLNVKESSNWYFGKAHIYWGDYLMLIGKFKSAMSVFQTYLNIIEPYQQENRPDYFEAQKQLAHCYRFNMFLDDAISIYESLQADATSSLIDKCYAITCLCESLCYFKPEFVICNYETAIDLCHTMAQERSIAKILYSAAIAHTQCKEYEKARNLVEKSILINSTNGYIAGTLFAKIAYAYIELAQTRVISPQSVSSLKDLVNKLGVYEYLMLPIYLVLGDIAAVTRLEHNYEWINFQTTCCEFRKFITRL